MGLLNVSDLECLAHEYYEGELWSSHDHYFVHEPKAVPEPIPVHTTPTPNPHTYLNYPNPTPNSNLNRYPFTR